MALTSLALVLAGCGGGEDDSSASSAPFDRAFIDAMVPHHDALGLSESELGMQHDSSAFAGSGDVDGDFARMMIDHHQGAIDMAKLAIERAERREIGELAEAIIDVQQIEIEILRPHASGQHDGG